MIFIDKSAVIISVSMSVQVKDYIHFEGLKTKIGRDQGFAKLQAQSVSIDLQLNYLIMIRSVRFSVQYTKNHKI